MAKQPAEIPAEDPEAPPTKKRGKLIVIVAVLVLLLGAGGGGAWFFMRPSDTSAAHPVAEARPAVFLPLESFTVNLVAQDGQPQYLQAGLTLKLGEDVKTEAINKRMPEIRNRILMVLSGKQPADLLSVSGKYKLAAEIGDGVRDVIGPAGINITAAHPAPAPQAAPRPGEAAAASTTPVPAAPVPAAAVPKHVAAPASAPVSAGTEIEVLFTSFIIQ